MRSFMNFRFLFPALFIGSMAKAAPLAELQPFLEKHCTECHDNDTKKGGLDLTALSPDLANPKAFAAWVKVHDRVMEGEMPPKKKQKPAAAELATFNKSLADSLITEEQAQIAKEGRATQRRLNRYEYEQALRDLLRTPWLQLKDGLPEDGESHRFNKIGEALDVSYVQMSRYMGVADEALRKVMAKSPDQPKTSTTRFYARSDRSFTGKMKFTVFNQSPERATFPLLDGKPQPDVRAGKAPATVGKQDPKLRELESIGVVASTYEPLETKFSDFKAPVSGHYKLRIKAMSVWVGPQKGEKWYRPDLDTVTKGRRAEPITLYSETPPRLLRCLGSFDAQPEPKVAEFDVWLLAGETIRPDAARLFRSRPPKYHNPLAEKDGQPGVAYHWLEVKGPLYDEWPTAGHKLLFGDLPVVKGAAGKGFEIVSTEPEADAEKLMRHFIDKASRRPVEEAEVQRFLGVVKAALKSKSSFADAMIAGYTAVLCSPSFICLEEEKPGPLDDHALAARLSFFLWNSAPDAALRTLADEGKLHDPKVLRAQTDRLLNDPKSRRFVDAFLDYWLDLRKMLATAPDSGLYPDYYLDDLLTESAQAETQLFFNTLLHDNLPAGNLVASDFAMLNERLALHYGLPPVSGVNLRRVSLPADSPRGGLMTQASVLKVTANGTTTSPVLRGAWIMERILGKPPPPPPASVPAIEPDTRGATTIREQLDKHRSQESCAACHTKIDPAGFALENFDVMGGWRTDYRALADKQPSVGFGHNGQAFAFHDGQPVDASGVLPDGRKFKDVRELKKLLLDDEPQIARNLAKQLTVYATGAPVKFSDREQIEQMLKRTRASHYGVRSLVQEIVQSELFRNK